MSPRIQVLPTVPQIHLFLFTSYNHHSSAKTTFQLNYCHGLLNDVLVPKSTVFAMGQQRELLQLCDSHIWNPAVFANALGIKSMLDCYTTCKTGPAFVWPSTSPVHYTATVLVYFQFPTTPGPRNTRLTLPQHSHPTPSSLQTSTQLSGLHSYMSSLHQAFHDHPFTDIIFLAERLSARPKWKLQDTGPLVFFSLLYPWELAHSAHSMLASVSWVKK